MVFNTTNLFKSICCPEGDRCSLTSCMFKHDPKPQPVDGQDLQKTSLSAPNANGDSPEPAAKRRKVTYENVASKPPSRAELIKEQLATSIEPSAASSEKNSTDSPRNSTLRASLNQPSSLSKSVSPPTAATKKPPPPSSTGANRTALANSRTIKVVPPRGPAIGTPMTKDETLNPRLIPNDPAGHAKRSLFLKYMHAEMARLNQKLGQSKSETKHLLYITEQELIQLALNEEEKLAREQPTVYGNVVKNRIGAYKKMGLDDWAKQVKASFGPEAPQPEEEKPLETGLSEQEEAMILPFLVADQANLAKFGYISTPPTEAEAAEAALADETSRNYESCDRCGARFQVFPERNEEGLLASNGPCRHHPRRKMLPPKSKTDHYTGQKEPYHPCCNNLVGSPGCTSIEYHAFKSSSPARLAAVLAFATTPENKNPAKDKHGKTIKGVTFDCEMGYTVYGLELIRLTAVAWPSGTELVDVLVRPLGSIIDLNSRFSGVFPEHLTSAIPYAEFQARTAAKEPLPEGTLPIVPSPQAARDLLCTFLTPATPLLGHAIDNDLNSVRLCHPSVVDTILLYPHQRGLPYRLGLKALTSKHLGKDIQMGGDRGHDSLEDARATGELVRKSVGEKWRLLRNMGWGLGKEGLLPPGGEKMEAEEVAERVTQALGYRRGGKEARKRGKGSKDEKDFGVAAYLPDSGVEGLEKEKEKKK